MAQTGVNEMSKKISKGRQKIEIKKIEGTNSRQVTFSKRRTGLFKKAAELCVLTGAHIAILVTSPGGRVYAFGHPNADTLFDRFLKNNDEEVYVASEQFVTNELNQHFDEVSRELEVERKRNEMVSSSSNDGLRWYEKSIDGMDVGQLEEYLSSLEELKKNVVEKADDLVMRNNNNLAILGLNSLFDKWLNDNNAQSFFDYQPTNSVVNAGVNFS